MNEVKRFYKSGYSPKCLLIKYSQQRDGFKVLHQSFFHFMQSQWDHHLSHFL